LDELWLQVSGNTLQKPSVGVDLTVVVVLQSKDEVNFSSSEVFIVCNAKIVGIGSKQMEQVVRILL
jgi:hypothetical protein